VRPDWLASPDHDVKLRLFDALTFDCYGTLIDWETGMFEALKGL
jgi:2-haloacid dehalogenase